MLVLQLLTIEESLWVKLLGLLPVLRVMVLYVLRPLEVYLFTKIRELGEVTSIN